MTIVQNCRYGVNFPFDTIHYSLRVKVRLFFVYDNKMKLERKIK